MADDPRAARRAANPLAEEQSALDTETLSVEHAQAILEESDERADRHAAPDHFVEHRRSEETTDTTGL